MSDGVSDGVRGSSASHPGLEARAAAGDHQALRLWLRLLATSARMEADIRRRLRRDFGFTLARFDYLAQLHRHPDGLSMSELSRCLMVTGGNVTALTEELVKLGHVARGSDPADGRSVRVRLTAQGQRHFEQMAGRHEGWVIELMAPLAPSEQRTLFDLLGPLRQPHKHR